MVISSIATVRVLCPQMDAHGVQDTNLCLTPVDTILQQRFVHDVNIALLL